MPVISVISSVTLTPSDWIRIERVSRPLLKLVVHKVMPTSIGRSLTLSSPVDSISSPTTIMQALLMFHWYTAITESFYSCFIGGRQFSHHVMDVGTQRDNPSKGHEHTLSRSLTKVDDLALFFLYGHRLHTNEGTSLLLYNGVDGRLVVALENDVCINFRRKTIGLALPRDFTDKSNDVLVRHYLSVTWMLAGLPSRMACSAAFAAATCCATAATAPALAVSIILFGSGILCLPDATPVSSQASPQ